jgi:hypothetical protein
MLALFPLLLFIVVVVLVVVLLIYNNKKEKERTKALEVTAAQLGWSFSPTAPMNMIAGLERFPLFNQGHGKKIKNFMYGQASGVKAAVFDYIYTVGGGKSSHTYFQSVVYLEPANLSLPSFTLRPENFIHKMLGAFGYQDIDFGQRPEFSKHYLLRGQDETSIRQAFNDQVLAFYESYGGTCTDAGGNQLFVFRSSYRLEPQEIGGYVGLGLQLMNLLQRS